MAGCKKEGETSPSLKLYEEGRTIYQTRCTACHNIDPHLPGALGPDIFGSTRELIEARVLRGEYPAGYTPKRSTKLMVPLPDLAGKIAALYAYLNDKK